MLIPLRSKIIIIASILVGLGISISYLSSNNSMLGIPTSETTDSQKLTTFSSEKLNNQITWDRVVEDSKHAWDGLIAIKDLYSPEDVDLTVSYNSHTGQTSSNLRFFLLDASIWMYLITEDEEYLEQARKVADDIEKYLLSEKNLVRVYHVNQYPIESHPSTNKYVLESVSKLALLDPNYNELVSKLADAMIQYEIESKTNLIHSYVFPNGTVHTKEMYFPYGGDVAIKGLLNAYEATSNEIYLSQAYNSITSYWDLRNKTTNLLPSWVFSDTMNVKEDFMQQYGAGAFLKTLLHYYYLTGDETIYNIIEEYTESITTYFWDGTRWNYRVNSDGSVLSTLVEGNFAKLDDALFLVYDLDRSAFYETYEKAKSDYDSTFQNDLILTNTLVKHAVEDNGTDNVKQSMIWYAFPIIQNTAIRLYHDTEDNMYLKKQQDFYNAITKYHKRDLGYIGSVDPYTFEDDSYDYLIAKFGTGIVANKIFSTIKSSSTVHIVWTTIGSTSIEEPFIETFYDSGWFNAVKFNYAEKEIRFKMVTGKGTITFPDKIESVTMNDEIYRNFEENMLKTTSGTNSYTVRLGTK